jgi:DNA invertase Pin-like site-specific DNA recombinase
MPTPEQHETEDQEKPKRAVIYLSEPVPDYLDEPRDELSIDQQRVLCRCVATAMRYEVVGEFTDSRADLASRPGLRQVIETVETQRIDVLFITSLERLSDSYHGIVKVSWKLGRAGTVPVPVEVGIGLPTKARPSRD